MTTVVETPKSPSLARTLSTNFVLLSAVALLILGGIQTWLNFQSQQAVVANEEKINASRAANQVVGFVEQKFSVLNSAAQVGRPLTGDMGTRQLLLQNLLALEPAFREVVLLNSQGHEINKESRLAVVTSSDFRSRADSELFRQTSRGERYISTVRPDEVTNEPLVTMGVPINNAFGEFQGVLAAEVNLKSMWDVVDRLTIGQSGVAYVVDKQGNLIAFKNNSSWVLAGENVSHLPDVAEFISSGKGPDEAEIGIFTGINGTQVLGTYVPLVDPDWAVMTELPVTEAYQDVLLGIGVSLSALVIVVVLAGVAGTFTARRVAKPLLDLTQTVTRIATGKTHLRAEVEGPAEIASLAGAFNNMTVQLQELIDSLEERVTARTRRLEVAAEVSGRLSAILDVEVLLTELVNQVKENFDYYHAHVYLFDKNRQNLVLTAGVGEAGAEMKAQGHAISVDAPTSLVARAARRGQVVSVENVRDAEDWLPNPLLPKTHSEMAVPILLDDQIVGVLDVQEDEIAGLDEGDAGLLQLLANQAAIAIRNARLFSEVEEALAQTRETQERYLAEAWQHRMTTKQQVEYNYRRPDVGSLDPAVVTELEQVALAKNQVVVVSKDDEENGRGASSGSAVVTPINLQNQAIGAIQLHETAAPRQWRAQELALIQAVANQVAQTAENLRLFDETRERAGYEQLTREIADKMRSVPDISSIIEVGVQELARVLDSTHTVVELNVTPNGAETLNNGQNN